MIQGLHTRDILTTFSNHNSQLRFVVDLFTDAWQNDWTSRSSERVTIFCKETGNLWNRQVRLLGMTAIVQSEADNLVWVRNRSTKQNIFGEENIGGRCT